MRCPHHPGRPPVRSGEEQNGRGDEQDEERAGDPAHEVGRQRPRHLLFRTRLQSRRRDKSCASSPRQERWSAVRAFFIAVPPSPLGMAVFRAFTTIGAPDHGKEVALAGWVEDVRNLGGIAFLILRPPGGPFPATAKEKAGGGLLHP